jgi:hypothetical protein
MLMIIIIIIISDDNSSKNKNTNKNNINTNRAVGLFPLQKLKLFLPRFYFSERSWRLVRFVLHWKIRLRMFLGITNV